MKTQPARFPLDQKGRPAWRRRALEWVLALIVALHLPAAAPGQTGGKQLEMSELPMFTRMNPPPPAIMLMIDDSYSMDHEVLVAAFSSGDFKYPLHRYDSNTGKWEWIQQDGSYLFKRIPGDYREDQDGDVPQYFDEQTRKFWRSQWCGANRIFYNPKRDYSPWLKASGAPMPNANVALPLSDPMRNYTVDLGELAFTVGSGASVVKVPHAHYFMYSDIEKAPYLVVVDGGIRYYRASVAPHPQAVEDWQKTWWEMVTALTETSEASTPADVKTHRSYAEERQNFANWFSYHRRREFVAKDAVARLILSLKNVRVGLYGINSHSSLPNSGGLNGKPVLSPLKPVKVAQGDAVADKTPELLESLYTYRSQGMTPLRKGLNQLGQFFQVNDGKLPGTNLTGAKPFEESCQQAVTVIITDGYYNQDAVELPAGERNADGDNGPPYADDYSDTLADIAMYYYERDLRPNLENIVPPVNAADINRAQHMVTYAIAFGVKGVLNPDDYVGLKSKADGKWIVWPNPVGPAHIDDLWHAAVNGRGQFFSVFTPEDMQKAMETLSEAFSDMARGSTAQVAVNGDKISAGSLVFQASHAYEKGEWKGDLDAYSLDPATGRLAARAWSAAAALETQHWDSGRVIATYDPERKSGVPFRLEELSDTQKGLLGNKPGSLVEYLRGREVDGMRPRTQKLGDIVNSSPVFLATDSPHGVVFVGANDGMLHAFNSQNGQELFAYVPNLVFHKLKELASPTYTHKFYVDLSPVVKKGVEISPGNRIDLLVGGLRRGGKGYFALNVTQPMEITSEAALKARVMWEAPSATDPDMGYSFCRPIVVRSNSTAHPWVVIFANGYNSLSEKAVLYILDPKDGAAIRKIEADAGTDNGLSTPLVVDANYDDKVDFLYAGDLKGNLWKFDLRDADPAKWGVAFKKGSDPAPLFQAKDAAGKAQPITTKPDVMYHPEKPGFLVCFGTGKYFYDDDFKDNSVQSIYGIWDYGDAVYDLRGKIWSPDDDGEHLGAFDRGAASRLSNQPAKVDLLEQTATDIERTIGGEKYRLRLLTDHKPAWKTEADPASGQNPDPAASEPNHAGYFIDLPAGERVINDVIIRGGLLLALGFKPTVDVCGSGGNSMFMEINAFTGGSPIRAMFDINGDHQVDAGDLVAVDGRNVPPAGIQFSGFIQTPAILRLGPLNTAGIEMKYFSASDGGVRTLAERAPKLGLTHWMEVRY
jgi:type IV pilus assembly protein PilY1